VRRRLPLILCCLFVGLLLPAHAGAQNSNAAPGVSALDEYFETVPTASGGQITHGIAAAPRPDGPPSAPAVPAPAAAALKRAGKDGDAVLELTRNTARVPAPAAAAPAIAPHVPDDAPSGLATIAGVFVGSSEAGSGIRLPLVLLLTALPLILLRLRSRSRP